MNLALFKKHVTTFVSRPRRRAGVFGLAALLAMSLPSLAATYSVDASGNPAGFGVVTGFDSSFGGVISNGVNSINDPVGAGVVLKVAASNAATTIFSSWSGTLAASMPDTNSQFATVDVATNGTLVANFDFRSTLGMALSPAGSGSTVPSGSIVIPRSKAYPIKATPTTGYEFLRWSVTAGTPTIADLFASDTTVIPVVGSVTLTALFQPMPRLTVTAPADGGIYVETPITNEVVAASTSRTFPVPTNGTVSVTAMPASDKDFLNWFPTVGVVADPSNSTTTVTMNKAKNLTVVFQPKVVRQTLITVAGVNGTVSPNGTNQYVKDSFIDITASPNAGYMFWKWTTVADGPVNPALATVNPLVNIQMNQDRNFKALFTNLFTVTAMSMNGPATPSFTFNVAAGTAWSNTPPNKVVGLATERDRLQGYADGTGDVIPAAAAVDMVYVSKATTSSYLRWVWQKQYLLITSSSIGGNISPATGVDGLWFDAYTTNTISAVADAGYVLDQWKVNGTVLPHKNDNFQLVMDGYKTVEAVFIPAGARYIPLWWKQKFGLDSSATDPNDTADGDPDNDGLSNWQEFSMMVTNVAGLGDLYMDPLNADTDADGMDDGFERTYFDLPRAQAQAQAGGDGAAFISAAMLTVAPYGGTDNPDGDALWDTASGYLITNVPLSNLMEYTGPDSQAPTLTWVPWASIFTSGAAVSWRKDVYRKSANPADTGDKSDPLMYDTDEDGFDDGYEYSWDQWQRFHSNINIQKSTNWVLVTSNVPDWTVERPYNPSVMRLVLPGTVEPDYDWLYDVKLGSPLAAFDDYLEYQASDYASGSNAYPVVRFVKRNAPWCTNPFLWDTDGDALPDGWEITFGYDPWAIDTDGNKISDAAENPDGDAYARAGADPTSLYHREVYDANGFVPGTAWLPVGRVNLYSNILEFIGDEVLGAGSISNAMPTWLYSTTTNNTRSSNPRDIDSDRDGMHDGWEMYMGFDPASPSDAGENQDPDALVNWQEFIGSSVIAYWKTQINASNTPDVIQAAWSNFSYSWPNKILPTDPFNPDTDHDQLLDSTEQNHFNYATNGVTGPGGGLNPDSVDTDLDYLPDAWERYWEGSLQLSNDVPVFIGLDGSRDDALEDPDKDGLYNYQEYMVGSCYQFQWLFNDASLTLDDPVGSGYDPYDFFDISLSGNDPLTGPGAMGPYTWDPAYWADRMSIAPYKPFTFLGGIPSSDPELIVFSTCDPNSVDSDADGYDDFFELYHSLNPIRGSSDMVPYKCWVMDPTYSWPLMYDTPFRWGERPSGPVADYDQDGQVDVEENLTANLPAVLTYSHTDPSPYFVGDVSSTESYVNKFYKTGNIFGARCFWYWDVPVLLDMAFPTAYLFSFEMNEGYDTDNDLKSDGVEIVGASPGSTDPLDDDSPVNQRALFLNGVDAAARIYGPTFHDWSSFRSFTIEAWVKPTSIDGDRVVVERAGTVIPGNPGLPGAPRVTRNFRLGINEGIPYVSYNGYGVSWAYEMVPGDSKYRLVPNTWRHLAASYDPVAKQLKLYVDGELAGSKSTAQIPFNGFIAGDPNNTNEAQLAYGMAVTVGAADENPSAYCDGTRDDIKSGFYAWTMSPGNNYPALTNYFAGWIDEVHLWDGTRSANQIRALRTQKLTRRLINSINGVQTGNQTYYGDMGGNELNPKMLYAFTFDGLPDPAEAKVPDGFADAVQVPGWDSALWWGSFPFHSSEYNDYRFVKWIQNMASHQPFDPPRDTYSVTMFNTNGTTNVFPNTSNPYTFEYTHGQGGSWESHPQYGATRPILFVGLTERSTAREFSGVFGDLLPLGAAKGDGSILMWDGSMPVDLTRDQDLDGLPDVWEELHGQDPFNPLDAQDDPDRDGLSTLMEYLIGSDPFGAYSLSPSTLDFFAYTNGATGPYRFLGEENTDMDYMDDLWEEGYWLNTEMYDAMGPKADPDNDGWCSLSEFQEVANLVGSSGGFLANATNLTTMFTPLGTNTFYTNLLADKGLGANAVWNDPQDERFHPVPRIMFRFNYAGKERTRANPHFIVLAYSDRSMDIPDAHIRGVADRTTDYPRYMALTMDRDTIYSFPADWFDPETLFSSWDNFYDNIGPGNAYAFEGSVHEGTNWFWGFMDLNGDNVYQSDEPAGFAGPVNVRWGTVGPIDIPLTDKRPMGFARFSWDDVGTGTGGGGGASTNASAYDPDLVESFVVYVVDKNVANAPTVYSNRFSRFRTWVDEADIMARKKTLKGFKRPGGYQWYVRAEYDNVLHDVKEGIIYENYKNPMPAPTLIWPVSNARLRQSRDTFIWKMDPTVTYCTLKVTKRDTGKLVLTHSFAPPARNIKGYYSMQMPIYMGDGVFENGVYDYALTVRTPVSVASATNQFLVKVGDYPGSSHSLSGEFLYPGKVTNGTFIVEAFTSPGFGGDPVGRRILPNAITASGWPTNTVKFTIRGLPADTYYVRAYLDQNGSYPYYTADDFESQGWYAKNFYWPLSVVVSGTQTTKLDQYIKILMHDLDNDLLPDDWEYFWTKGLTAYGLGDLRGYTPSLNGILNVFECYGGARFGLSPK